MTTSTPNLSLLLYNSTTDNTALFSAFREAIAGDAITSNFYKIDTAYGVHSSDISTLTSTLVSNVTTLKSINGQMINGVITPTVNGSDGLVLSLKTFAGTDPSALDPVYITINNTLRTITSALSVTVAAGASSFSAGSAEHATKEIDYFVYLGYNTALGAVVIGFARFPYGRAYSQFSATSTSERYCAISNITGITSTDNFVNVGRFAATLSAGAGYTWTVPTFTSINLRQTPTFTTRYLDYQPVYSGSASMTYTSVTTTIARYRIFDNSLDAWVKAVGTTGGTTSSTLIATLPMNGIQSANNPIGYGVLTDTTLYTASIGYSASSSPHRMTAVRYDSANITLGTNKAFSGQMTYEI